MVQNVVEAGVVSERIEERLGGKGPALGRADYVSRFTRQVDDLVRDGFLLEADAEAMKERAAESEVGKPGTCVD